MSPPPTLHLADEAEYRDWFEAEYVTGSPVMTPDGITVRFYANQFDHAFRISVSATSGKVLFSWVRAKRLPWIRAVVESSDVEVYRRLMRGGAVRRIEVLGPERYGVVLQLDEPEAKTAIFITAYVEQRGWSLRRIRANPPWTSGGQ